MHLLDQGQPFARETAPAKPLGVDAVHGQWVAGDGHEGRHILADVALEAGDHVGADLAELVHPGEPAHDGPVAHLHVASQGGVVGQYGLVAQLHIVRQMHIGHDPVVVAHAGHALVLRGAAVEGAELADGVAVADVQLGGLTGVLLVLRRCAQGCVRINLVVSADGGRPLDDAMGAYARSAAHLHTGANHRIGAYSDVRGELSADIDDGRGVYQGHRPRSPCAWCTSAQPRLPSARPRCHGCGSGKCRPCGGQSRTPGSIGRLGPPAA